MFENNPLFDKDFLLELDNKKERKIYAKIIALTNDERPVEQIEGKVTSGSINVDGTSAVRRTCSLSMVAKDVNINEYYWGFKNKFKLEIGIENDINPKYPNIIWFKMGTYVINSFNTSQSVNNYSISISGKDKMCLLNGDLSGSLPHSTDFGIEEEVNNETGVITYTAIPVKRIIREAVQNFGGESAYNIIIQDVEDNGLDLLEYRGDIPLYIFKNEKTQICVNMTVNQSQNVYYKDDKGEFQSRKINTIPNDELDNLVDLQQEDAPKATVFYLSTDENATPYTICKFEYGSIIGYRETDLVYAGELIAGVGESVCSVLDKIQNMLGEFEYFYDVDGRFIFRKKPYSITTPWSGTDEDSGDQLFQDTASTEAQASYVFTNGNLISAFSNNPNLLNLRNDYAVWGTYKSINGSELPIHMRYAIDKKPTQYYSLKDECWYYSKEYKGDIIPGGKVRDWRELIYKMALDFRRFYHEDDFIHNLIKANVVNDEYLYPTGKTGYEQYYIDLEGFWRQLYNPNPELKYESIDAEKAKDVDDSRLAVIAYQTPTKEECETLTIDNIYLYQDAEKSVYPFLQSNLCFIEVKDDDIKNTTQPYYWKTSNGSFNQGTTSVDIINPIPVRDLYYKSSGKYINYIDRCFGISDLLSACKTAKDSYLDAQLQNLSDLNEKEAAYLNIQTRLYNEVIRKKYLIKSSKAIPYTILKEQNSSVYQEIYSKKGTEFTRPKYDRYGQKIMGSNDTNAQADDATAGRAVVDTTHRTAQQVEYEKLIYSQSYYDYYTEEVDGASSALFWSKTVYENPESLLFWFDFLDAEGSELGRFSVPTVGVRSKAIKDDAVKTIYYRDIPNVIFKTPSQVMQNNYDKEPGYIYIQLQGTMENLFTISSKGKSAKESIDELLYNHGCCIESANITALPIYYLQPNTRIYIKDDKSGIDGEYIISRLSYSLAYNGTMSITATKAVSSLI